LVKQRPDAVRKPASLDVDARDGLLVRLGDTPAPRRCTKLDEDRRRAGGEMSITHHVSGKFFIKRPAHCVFCPDLLLEDKNGRDLGDTGPETRGRLSCELFHL
jgi:hypothetical protein